MDDDVYTATPYEDTCMAQIFHMVFTSMLFLKHNYSSYILISHGSVLICNFSV